MEETFYYSFYDAKRLQDWMNDSTKEKGATRLNVVYLREIKQLNRELARIGVLTFFMATRLGIENCWAMMKSAGKQKNLLYAVRADLKKYAVTDRWAKTFERDLGSIRRRCDHIYRICRENLRYTEHYPYFDAVGFDKLVDFPEQTYSEDNSTVLDELLPEMEMWEANHKDIIQKHMESARAEREAYERHKAEVVQKDKDEKAAKKALKKAENAEIKEMRENERKYKARQRKLEKEFQTTMRRVGT